MSHRWASRRSSCRPSSTRSRTIRQQGVTVFLVEQNAFMALNIADRGYVLQQGKIVLTDSAKNLLTNDLVRRAYLGG